MFILVDQKKKGYSIPQVVLSYFSPVFEQVCTEAKGTKLVMLDMRVKDFDMLAEYMMCGTVPGGHSKCTIEDNKTTVEECLRFLELADEFRLIGVADFIYEPLRKAFHELTFHKYRNNYSGMRRIAKSGLRCGIEGSNIEIIFRLTPAEPTSDSGCSSSLVIL